MSLPLMVMLPHTFYKYNIQIIWYDDIWWSEMIHLNDATVWNDPIVNKVIIYYFSFMKINTKPQKYNSLLIVHSHHSCDLHLHLVSGPAQTVQRPRENVPPVAWVSSVCRFSFSKNTCEAYIQVQTAHTYTMILLILLTYSKHGAKERILFPVPHIWMPAGRHSSAVTHLHSPLGAISAPHFHSRIKKADNWESLMVDLK